MYHSDAVIRQLQAQRILAEKLDNAVAGVIDAVSDQVNKINKGATRLSFYASCFTDEYIDVCKNQMLEDNRFRKAVVRLIKDRDIVFSLLQTYIEYQLEGRSYRQLEAIKMHLMRANIHIAASTLTTRAFGAGATMAVVMGMNITLPVGRNVGAAVGAAASLLGIYAIVQNAADSAKRLQIMHPPFYHALYMRELEMMYFLIEPSFMRAGALKNQWLSDYEVAEVLMKLVGK
ncbi:hypothetical protein AC790_22370 [Pantoea sp. RIT-PI-b]|uniref:hypothetical protein n=1 Tax=Pantoea sp. RIT-PI-b TaxID=1681195 RepID=UPI000675D406|nr:hypothetical protein [Pantoea sp. RIT-PI-b]KNC05765.1 hypothetical protein AC790_22370 [Pantoea sp. RIT-PI-b]